MSANEAFWVHDLSPFLFRFPDNPLGLEGIRYYGLAYILGFVGAWVLLRLYHRQKRLDLPAEDRANLMTAIILGVLVGGRLGYMLLYDLAAFLGNPLLFFRVDQGGMASHGGFAGVILALVWFASRHRIRLLDLGDAVATVAPLGLGFGRVANFINGELWGRVSRVEWAVVFPQSPPVFDPATGTYGVQPRHPSQLYEAALEGFFLFAYLQFRFWRARPRPGQLGGEFLCGYGLLRILGELYREPDASLILGLSRGQFYSLFLILGGLGLIVYARRRAAQA